MENMTRKKFIGWMAAFLAVTMFWVYVFMPWPWAVGKWVLYGALAVSAGIGTAVCWNWNRNFFAIAVFLLAPVEICLVALYARHLPWLVGGVMGVAVIAGVWAGIRLTKRLLRYGWSLRIFKKIAVTGGIKRGLTVAILVGAVLPVLLTVGKFADLPLYQCQTPSIEGCWAVDDVEKPVQQLENWDNLSLQQRLDALGQVRNAEIFYQSIGYPVALRADHLNGSPAWYEQTKQRITLDSNFLQNASAEAAVSAILRACRLIHRDSMLALYDSDPEFYADVALTDWQKDANDYIQHQLPTYFGGKQNEQ